MAMFDEISEQIDETKNKINAGETKRKKLKLIGLNILDGYLTAATVIGVGVLTRFTTYCLVSAFTEKK